VLDRPGARQPQRAAAVNEVFYDPGRATERALALCYALLECPIASSVPAGVTAG
jgi:hypothetical protein